MAAEKIRPNSACDRPISPMITVTMGAVAKSSRCKRKAMRKGNESMSQRDALPL
jgi:hypothetical protein